MRWLATVICWLILIWLATGMLNRLTEDVGSHGPSSDPRVVDSNANSINHSAPASKESGQTIKRHFLAAPLSSGPFVELLSSTYSGAQARTPGRRRVAEHLLKITPRSTFARISLAEIDFLSGDYAGATHQISYALALGGSNSSALLDALVEMAKNPETRPFVADLIESKPRWSSTLLMRLAPTSAHKAYLWEWAEGDKRGEAAVVSALLRQDRIDLAYDAFLTFLTPESRVAMTAPFDAHFEGLPGAGPFTWSIDARAASFEPNGGLAVSSYGQTRKSIAHQVTKLPSGLAQAKIMMSGDISEGGNSFEWAIYCYSSRTPFWTLPATELSAEPVIIQEHISVPDADCEFQRVELAGLPGDFPRTGRALIQKLEISRQERSSTQ